MSYEPERLRRTIDDDDGGVFETSNALVSLNTTDGTISSVLFTGPVLLHPNQR